MKNGPPSLERTVTLPVRTPHSFREYRKSEPGVLDQIHKEAVLGVHPVLGLIPDERPITQ